MWTRGNTNKIKEFLSPNKLIYVIDISDTVLSENQEETTLDISGIIFDDQDLTIIEKQLMFFGRVRLEKRKNEIFYPKHNFKQFSRGRHCIYCPSRS